MAYAFRCLLSILRDPACPKMVYVMYDISCRFEGFVRVRFVKFQILIIGKSYERDRGTFAIPDRNFPHFRTPIFMPGPVFTAIFARHRIK